MTVIDEQQDSAPWTPWPRVHSLVNRLWDPENTPHHSIIGLTGSGKSYLAVNGILRPMCAWDRVLIIDSKGDDKLVSSQGKGVKEIPAATWKVQQEQKPYDHWYRLIVGDERNQARAQVGEALNRVYHEGNWVLFIDELADITSREDPNLNLRALVDRIYRKGRSKHISLIACTQSPVNVPRTFYDQASFAWIGRIRDEQRQKRLLEIGGMTRHALPIIAGLQRRQWLLAADNGEHLARTTVS